MPTAALPDEEASPATPTTDGDYPVRRRLAAAAVSIGLAATAIIAGALVTRDPAEPAALPSATASASAPAVVVATPVAPVPPFYDVVPPIPTVSGAREVGAIKQQGRIVSRDNGQSTRYGDQSIWVFADTLMRSPWGVLSNSGAATTDLKASDGISLTAADLLGNAGEFPTEFVPRTQAELAFQDAHQKFVKCAPGVQAFCNVTFSFWPGPIVADPARHRVLVFYDKLCRGGAKGQDCSEKFGKDLGTGIASLDMTTHQVTRLTAINAPVVTSLEGVDPTMFFPSSSKYASAAVVVGDDVYVYGSCDSKCHVARAPLATLDDRSQWRFYSGRDDQGVAKWSANPDDAVDVVRSGAAGNTVLWDPALHGWLNVFMPYDSNVLKAQIGGSPFGPWSDAFTLLATDDKGNTNYAAYGHSEYAERNGLVQYMSYYQNATGAQRLVKVTFAPGD